MNHTTVLRPRRGPTQSCGNTQPSSGMDRAFICWPFIDFYWVTHKGKKMQTNKGTPSLTPANYAEIQGSNENHKAFTEIRAPNLPQSLVIKHKTAGQ